MLPVMIIVFAVFAGTVDGFLSVANMRNMALQFSPLLICATGATLVFLIGGIDLSAGAVMSLAAVGAALVMRTTDSVVLGVAAGIACGVAVGAVNGVAIARFRLAAFVQTLAALLTVRAIAFLLSDGRSVGKLPPLVRSIGRSYFLGLPVLMWLALAIAAGVWMLLARTSYGRRIYLVGANRRAAIFSGINVLRLEFQIYLAAATLSALGGVAAVMWLGAGAPVLGDNFLLQIIAAVVIGGTSIQGGYGGMMQTLSGAAIIVMLDRGLDLAGLAYYDQWITLGFVILAGSALGGLLGRLHIRRAEKRKT